MRNAETCTGEFLEKKTENIFQQFLVVIFIRKISFSEALQ